MMQPHPVAVLGCQVVQTLRQVETPVSWPTLIRPSQILFNLLISVQ
jgi:ABC-type spermidine/putrescine transport system permease subunit I